MFFSTYINKKKKKNIEFPYPFFSPPYSTFPIQYFSNPATLLSEVVSMSSYPRSSSLYQEEYEYLKS